MGAAVFVHGPFANDRKGVDYEVLPLQPACPQEQSMSGVFSIASHWALQYFPDVVMQEQTGCAHFSPVEVAMSFLLFSDEPLVIRGRILIGEKRLFCSKMNTVCGYPQTGEIRCRCQGLALATDLAESL
jgi:hypothetical protein